MNSINYFSLEQDVESSDFSKHYASLSVGSHLKEENTGHDLKWMNGNPINENGESSVKLSLILEYALPKKFPDLVETMRAPIVSTKFVESLKEYSDFISFYPITIIDNKDRQKDGFFVMNILKTIEGVDREESKLSTDGSAIARIKHLVLKDSIKEIPIFRLSEYRELIFINEEIANIVKDMKNVKLLKAEGYSDEHRF